MAFGGGEASKWLPQISIPLSCLPHIVKVFSAICDPHMGPTGTGQVQGQVPSISHTHACTHTHTHTFAVPMVLVMGQSLLSLSLSLNVKFIQS